MEIQGRTLFEEGWSEIDHDIVYPYYKDDEMLKDFSTLLNRLSGMADEMSSYFRRMRSVRDHRRESVFFIYSSEQECYTHMLSVLTSQMQYIDQ